MDWYEVLRVNDGALIVEAQVTNQRLELDPDGEPYRTHDLTGLFRFTGSGHRLVSMELGSSGQLPAVNPNASEVGQMRGAQALRVVDLAARNPNWDGSILWQFMDHD